MKGRGYDTDAALRLGKWDVGMMVDGFPREMQKIGRKMWKLLGRMNKKPRLAMWQTGVS